MKRRKRAKNFVISSLLISLVLMIISPWISLFASLLLIGAASWGVSPSRDLRIGHYAVKRQIYNTELEKIEEGNSEYRELIIMMALFLSIFFLSIFLLYLGWNGLLSYLFT
ncbi:hypothetical protein ABOONEI_725 [Aciduliprofundum boonei T469]|nr:hypothetical protein ABOONEI_725 [Aciduliprofundum boonei T469]